MARVEGRRTKVIHESCAAVVAEPQSGCTHRELLEIHGMQYLAGCGFERARRFVDELSRRRMLA